MTENELKAVRAEVEKTLRALDAFYQATVAGRTSSNRFTATTAPVYCEMPAIMNNASGEAVRTNWVGVRM